MDFDPARFGINVRRLRQAKQWGVRELAKRAGVATNTVLRLEHGLPGTRLARTKVARALGTFEECILMPEDQAQRIFEYQSLDDARWRASFFSPERKLPPDVDVLVQDPGERRRLAELGWIARYERYTAPRLGTQFPGMRMMEIWRANGVRGTHNDVELATAVRGGVTILLGDDRIELQEGEGISFRANIPHDYEPVIPLKRGDPPVVVLYVLVPLPEPPEES